MPRATRFDVVVAGRGAAGCAAALGLAQQGVRVALVARAASASSAIHLAADDWDPRVFALSPASMQLLERLRVASQLDRTRIAPVYDMEIHGDAADRPSRLRFSAYGACVRELAAVVEGRQLQRVLELGCSMHANVQQVDAHVQAFERDDDRVSLKLEGASANDIEADLLIAADGAASPIRALAGIQGKQRDYAQSGLVADFEAERPHSDIAYQWFLGDSVLALLPMASRSRESDAQAPSRIVSIVWSMPHDEAQRRSQLDPAALASEVRTACGQRLGAMHPLGRAHVFPLHYFNADTLVQPRLALVGDAAHVMHPLAGQGLNAGFADVAALLDVVAAREAFRNVGDLRLLRRYARARAADLALLMTSVDGLQRLFHTQDRLLRTARNLGLNLVDRLPVLKHALIRQAVGRPLFTRDMP